MKTVRAWLRMAPSGGAYPLPDSEATYRDNIDLIDVAIAANGGRLQADGTWLQQTQRIDNDWAQELPGLAYRSRLADRRQAAVLRRDARHAHRQHPVRGGSMNKLAVKLKDAELAAVLVEAGFTNPRQIRDASDKDLRAVPGVGTAALAKIRGKFPRG